MPYLGQSPKESFDAAISQTITGTGATSYSLTRAVNNPEELEVFINNVQQQPTASYTVSGATITFDEALLSTDSCYVVFRSVIQTTRSVSTATINDDAVTQAKIASGAIDATELASTLNLASKTLTIPTTTIKPMFVNFYASGVLTLTNDTETKISMVNGDNNGLTWDASNHRVTFDATTAGKYLILMSVSYYSSTNNMSECLLVIKKNGSIVNHPLFDASGTGGGVRMDNMRHICRTAMTIETFASGQYLDFHAQMQVDSGSAQLQPRLYGTQGFIMRIND